MASSMLTAEVSGSASTESGVNKALKAALHTCANDPDFAIICDFLHKFAKDLGLDLPNFKLLLLWLTKTDEVSTQLRDMQIKLLRKTRKTVHEKSWESALSKFCFTYSAQDGWEIERFGYKNSSVKVKLRILRELLECQFERNTKFRAKILTLSADSLRSKPVGRDRQGHAYWVTQDNDCNIRIYQEHLDEEIWQVVATNRDEFVNLIKLLRGSEVVQPCKDIGIVDEDTSSSSHADSDSVIISDPSKEKHDSQEDEQKVPKLSIKLVHGKNPKETTNSKNLGKGEEEISAEEDVRLLKKLSGCNDAIESGEEEFEEIEEEYDDESGNEAESEDEISVGKAIVRQSETEQKVKPLLISQNKVLNNENCSISGIAGKKRALNQVDSNSPNQNENQGESVLNKSKTSLLDSKRSKTTEKHEDNVEEADEDDYEESGGEYGELEEVEEEDIDSVAAEEDENEVNIFEDYDDDDDDEKEVGKEICDPSVHVTGTGSGKDCDADNYLYFIDYDLDNNNLLTLSDVVVEDVCYVRGDGNGKDCLVGNKNENTLDTDKTSSEISKTNEEKLELKSELTLPEKENTLLLSESTSEKCVAVEDVLIDTKNLATDSDSKRIKYEENSDKSDEKSNEIKKQFIAKDGIGQLNGEETSQQVTSKNQNLDEKQLEKNKIAENSTLLSYSKMPEDENLSEASCNDYKKTKSENPTMSNADDSRAVDVLTQHSHATKMSALESVKKELRESKQKLLEKKEPLKSESSNIKISSSAIYNRKRRLTDQLQTTPARAPNSESEIDFNVEKAEDLKNDKDLQIEDSGEDVGGKRLKMRPKQANSELRKKIEAKKEAAKDETTSSSSGEEELKKRKKIILSKYTPNTKIFKTEKSIQNSESKNDNENFTNVDETLKSASLTQEAPAVKKSVPKVKSSLAEIIEKKLKKTSDKVQCNLTAANKESNMLDVTTTKKLFPSSNKSLLTKPLKKTVLTQITQECKDAISQKCANSEEFNSAVFSDVKSFEISIKCSGNETDSKICIDTQTTMLDRQRKRRSSEETVQHDSPEEPDAKKEVTVIKENILKHDKPSETIKKEDVMKTESKDLEILKETPMPFSGRRSGRRGQVIPTYVDNLQSKRNRGSTKDSTKKEFSESEKVKAVNTQSHDVDVKVCSAKVKKVVADKSNGNNSQDDTSSSTSLPKDSCRKKNSTEKSAISMAKTDVSKLKSVSTTKTPLKGARKQNEVDTTNIIDIDSETPVRQSRRIAQQKIREEAERRKLEEIALRTMKQELKKKKKAEKQCDPTVVIPPTEPSSESEESDIEIKRKVQKKKCPGKNGNWSSGSEEQEDPEEEDEEHHHFETDPGSPLFKSDHEFSPESDIEDESQVVPMKRARTVRKEDADTSTPDEEEEACQKCNKSDHPEWILLCDKCDKGYHCSCLSPVLFYIPEGDWHCPPCEQEQLIKALENQLKEFDNLVENKKKADEEEKRMAEEEKARQEKEEEINKHKTKKDKRINTKRNYGNSSAEDHSQEEDDDEEANTNSEDNKNSNSKKRVGNKTGRNANNSEKRHYRDRRRNITRSRRSRLKVHGSDFNSDSQSSAKSKSGSRSNSSSSSTYSESDNEPIYKLRKRRQINVSYRLNEYDDLINSALRKEMDDVAGAGNLGRGKDISTIIEADKEEKARQKQIEECEIVVKPKEVENDNDNNKETMQNSLRTELNKANKDENVEAIKEEENDSDAEPIMRKLNIKQSQKKKSRKLTTLDISSEDDDGSDEDFKGSSIDDEEDEEDTLISASNSDSSLEIYKRHGKFKKKRRKAARKAIRQHRRDRRFLVDESDDEEVQRPKSKKKRKDDSDYTESEADDDVSELSENIDSADLCDDTTTDESDGAWRPNKSKKSKKSNTSFAQKSPKSKSAQTKKHKKLEYSDDDVSESEDEDDDENEEVGSGKGMGKQPRSQPLKSSSNSTKPKGKGKEKPPAKIKKRKSSEDESNQSDSEDSTRRTRGRRYAYIEDFEDDSSDGGIKPGVQRPDTPPEEREKFIKRQEEIKRMLAEKNAEGAKLVATPRLTPIKTDSEKDKRSPAKAGGDSLSTVPLSVIRQAKVLDIDYLQRRGENLDDLSNEVGEVGDDFDDADLPDDLPEDMDEDAIARMVEEEEEFGVSATRELPAPDEVLRTATTVKPTKIKEVDKPSLPTTTSSMSPINSSHVTAITLPTPASGLQEPVRKRLPMPTMHPPLLRHQYLMHDSMSNTQQLMQRHGGPPTSHLLQNALSAPLVQPLERNYPSITPHHSLISRMAHSISLQPTVSQALNTTRPSHPPVAKSSPLLDQPTQEKSTNAQPVTEIKPRGRRKKITPLRDTLQKQQAAAAVTAATATSSALASSLIRNNDPPSSHLSSVIKSASAQKLPMQASVITSIPPTSHSVTNRPTVSMPPISGPYVRTDGPRYFDALGNRSISQTGVQRHRGSPQMPPSLLPPHPANRSSYGLPPPLKGTNSGISSPPNTSGSIRNPMRHVPPPYLGMPPNARHASHLNMYRPSMFGNPNFGPRVNLRPSNIHPPDFPPSSRAYPPYGFYPPPPPLTTPGQRLGTGSVPRLSTQMPPIQPTLTPHPPASVIVSAASSKLSNAPITTSQPPPPPPPTSEITDPNNSSSKSVLVAQQSSIKITSLKSSSPTPVIAQTGKVTTTALTIAEPRKKLTTLQAYVASSAKKSPGLPTSDSSGSRSPHNPPTDVNDDSSAHGNSENTSTAEQPWQEGQASEFSGLVSYFSSQHDDYNT